MLRFRVLGAVEARCREDVVPMPPKVRRLLAAVLSRPNTVVGATDLIEAVWESAPPASARESLRIYVHRLNQALGASRVTTAASGYLLTVGDDELDSLEFERTVRHGRQLIDRGDLATGAATLGRGLRMWRGRAFAELQTLAVVREEATRLDELRLTVTEERFDAELTLGRHGEIVAELKPVALAHPLREKLRAQLMTALWGDGRQAEALAAYRDAAEFLARELGLDPGPELRDLQQRILRQETYPARPRGSAPAVIPAQLAPPNSAFTGRARAARALDGLVAPGSPAPVAIVSGIAGVGKTALALDWAHRNVSRFPDGQLFADLRGYDRLAGPVAPHDLLGRFLRALGVNSEQIPADPDERAALYRSVLHPLRVLVLLDNAASAAQVRPLLPGARGCRVVVTARPRLEDLLIEYGAAAVPLSPLDDREAVDLLARVLGAPWVERERKDAERLARLCDGLPLALRLTAARLTSSRTGTLAELVAQLADRQRRLDLLSGEELQVRSGFELSCRDLPAPVTRAFRLLSLLDAPGGLAAWHLAALLDQPDLSEADALLDELVDAQLLQPLGVDCVGQRRFRFHDLVRLYAAERAEADEPEEERHAATLRAFGAMLALTAHADRAFRGEDIDEVQGTCARWLPGDHASLVPEPMLWLDAERLNLSAMVRQAARAGWSEPCWELTATGSMLRQRRGYQDDQLADYELALELCRREGNLRGTAALLLSHGGLHHQMGNLSLAAACASEAVDLYERLGDKRGHALALADSGVAHRVLADWEPALAAFERAFEIFEDLGDLASAAYVLFHLGALHLRRDHFGEAQAAAERGLALLPPGIPELELHLRRTLGDSYLRRGRVEEAHDILTDVLASARARRDLFQEAEALLVLGETEVAAGRPAQGRATLTLALEQGRQLNGKNFEGRVHLALGHIVDGRHIEHLKTAAEIFAAANAPAWHAKAMAALTTHRR
ncbi:BTAD domain-containing putative transcriptional regulator [Nonomuraea sp. C10]|uniref:AfsR/SARP family transcriptional regulator n=1 Tax=Nonomuraea sp. C10 TaxID=2600577 RepID=UPI0011CEC271|nr:BTAD domain-containing putative transcriptional regulator [Nonomuraea sp. C10]TXK34699.1 transcriptional regulator [Nonomuraea sp. C10]